MEIKENFPLAGWENLLTLPSMVPMTVVMSAPNVPWIRGETKAMIQEPAKRAAASGSSPAGLVIAGTQQRVPALVARRRVRITCPS